MQLFHLSADTLLVKPKSLNRAEGKCLSRQNGFFSCFGQKHLQIQVLVVFIGRFAIPQWAAKSHVVSFPHRFYFDIYSQVAGEGNKPVFQCCWFCKRGVWEKQSTRSPWSQEGLLIGLIFSFGTKQSVVCMVGSLEQNLRRPWDF